MLFGKEIAFLLVHKNGISFYVDRETFGLQFDFPKGSVDGLEVVNLEQIQAALATFLKENYGDTTHPVTMLLSKEITVDKILDSKEKDKQQGEVTEFLSTVSFSNPAKIVYKKDKDVEVVVANPELYRSLRKILGQYGWKTEAVVPTHLFEGLSGNDILTEGELEQIHKKSDYLKEGNFLHDEPEEEVVQKDTFLVPVEKKKPFYAKKLYWFLLLLLLLAGAIGYLLYSHPNLLSKVLSKTQQSPVVATATPTTAPSPTVTAAKTLAKGDVKVQVLNGTGKAGQAGTVKNALTSAGYTNVTTGNAPTSDNTDATVSFGKTISQAYQDEIIKALKDIFVHVTTSPNAPSTGFDVTIITGLQK